VLNAAKNMKAAAVRGAAILFTCQPKNKRNAEAGLIREGMCLIRQRQDWTDCSKRVNKDISMAALQ
jgi:hypothetical protein